MGSCCLSCTTVMRYILDAVRCHDERSEAISSITLKTMRLLRLLLAMTAGVSVRTVLRVVMHPEIAL